MTDEPLQKAAGLQNGVIQPGLCQEFLGAVLDIHQRHVGVFLGPQDRDEDVTTHASRFRRFDEVHFALPIYPVDGVVGTRRGRINHGLHPLQGRGQGLGGTEVAPQQLRPPLSQKGSSLETANEALYFVPFIQRSPNDLSAQRARGTNDQ